MAKTSQNLQFQRTFEFPKDSFFLFGARGTGKTTWLKSHLAKAVHIDLLDTKTFLQLSRDPSHLVGLTGSVKSNGWVIIDEIQKLPVLLDEVHRLIEEKKINFALTGSSARKLKRSGANLLAGRAILKELFPLTSVEMDSEFQLEHCLKWGGLPKAVTLQNPEDFLESYFHTYLKEEIREESLVRQIDPFIRFLEIAANLNGQILNTESISREAGSKRPTVDKWFTILQDTLVAHMLPSWRPGFKVRESAHPKLYWFDIGVARAAAGRLGANDIDSSWLGYALETWILHEVRSYNSYHNKKRQLYYYSLPSDVDIDLIIETRKSTKSNPAEVIALEIKSSKKWKREWEKPIKSLSLEKKCKVKHMIGVYMGSEVLNFDGFQVYPVEKFLQKLHAGAFF